MPLRSREPKTVIMSLWSVPARATALLMDCLFDEVAQQSTKDYAIALNTAQDYVKNATITELQQTAIGQDILTELGALNLLNGDEQQQPLSHLYYWAAWICQGG
ncbi:MAG: CHAT domain-containing protein [Synechococcaceae cyanobacterium RL_1_2]|nr:CHAT domain-containing protein [Synechococcaceae cyanobacterium RL_1_2]